LVQTREIDKNLIVETAQIDQTRQVQEAEIERTLRVETAKIVQEQSVKERDIERELAVQTAQIAQQEGVQVRDIERALATESARIDQERLVQTREIDKNLIVETAQIDQTRQVQQADIQRTLVVETARIDQELRVTLTDEDRKIAVQGKQRVTELAERDKLEAAAQKTEALVNVTAVQRTREAEWQREVAVINAESQARPIERIAEAILAEARAKAEGEMAHLQARNTAEQRVLVQEAVLEAIQTSPRLAEQLMKPVERIQSIKILDMGNTEGSPAARSNMGRVANALLDTGVLAPVLKELFSFAEVDAQAIANKVAEYLSALVGQRPSTQR
jgi:uncharacterized membrane protein YqiK